MHDVVVIGAGPAGATAARYLAMKGLDTCLIDKDEFPRDKPCGGGFSHSIVDDFPYLKPRVSDFIKGIARVGVVHSPNRRISLEGRVDMAVALRTDFDNVLFEEAITQAALPLTGTRVKSVSFKSEHVNVDVTGGKSIKARMVIGADGVTSLVARQTGLNLKWSNSSITACRVCEVPTKKQDIIDRYTEDLKYHFFANLRGKPGYGWIFPKEDTINVGIGFVGSHSRGLPGIFDAFVKYLIRRDLLVENSDLSGARGALVPTGGPIQNTVRDRCILLGDAAGHVNPLTGGGIVHAMRAARFAAHVIADNLEINSLDESSLLRYQRLWQSDFGNQFKNHLIAQKVFTGPFTDVLFRIGSQDKVIQEMVSNAMSESGEGDIDVKKLALRTLYVCLREALNL
ncbi:MAG: geranylgeranyl reductase family protein [Candidatus Thorarchaeota archaeon]|jgi:digeranylgeranylglycerophospholipid reductase